MIVTAAQNLLNGARPGMLLRVEVLNNVALAQPFGFTQYTVTQAQANVFTSQIGSMIYGAVLDQVAGTFTWEPGTTGIDNVNDTTNAAHYGTFSVGPTLALGNPLIGAVGAGSLAAVEFLPNGTITVDASSPAAVSTTTANFVSTANFTPPVGSLIVALVSSNDFAGNIDVAVSDSTGLVWIPVQVFNSSGAGMVAIWVAYAPASPAVLPPAPTIPLFPAGYEPQQADFTGWWYDNAWFLQKKVVFRARQTLAATVLPSTSATVVITLDTFDEDPYGGWGLVNANGWTPKISGWYGVTGCVQCAALTTSANEMVGCQIGGTWSREMAQVVGSNTHATGTEGTDAIYLQAGTDYVQLTGVLRQATANVNTSIAAGSQSSMEVIWLSS